MKDDISDGKKPQKQHDRGTSDAKRPPFQKDEDDVDFEILDALEQMEQAEPVAEENLSEDDQTIELTLDDEDMMFGEDVAEEGGGFDFDESMSSEEEGGLSDEIAGFSLDESFGEDMGEEYQADTEQEAFSLDLDLEEGQDELDLSLDQEMDFSIGEETGKISDTEFPPGAEKEIEFGALEAEDDTELEGFNLDGEEDDLSSGLGEEGEEEDVSFEQSSFDIGDDDTTFSLDTDIDMDSGEEISSEGPAGDFSDQHAESLLSEIEIGGDESDISGDFDEEEEVADTEFPETGFESESDEFQGKTVISVGDDQVIDLGDESGLEQDETFETDLDSWDQDEDFDMSAIPEEELDEETANFGEDMSMISDEGKTDLQIEQEEEDDFLASLEDMDINLEEEAAKALEELGSLSDDSRAGEETTDTDIDLEGGLDLTVDEDLEPEDAEIAGFTEEEPEAQEISDTYQESPEDQETEQDLVSPAITPAEKEALEETAESVEPEIDEREFLELTLRLSDEQMQEFENMVAEAKTLQGYLDGLDAHKPEIKGTIYQKLQNEYISRKTAIFGAPEFTSIHVNVEYDLQDMLAKREEFVTTVEGLQEELEEITVRHLVGEYTDNMLSEQEEAQKTEIAHWNEKTEKIEAFIHRYQESLEAEQELNPLRKESDLEEEISEEPEQEPISEPEVIPEQEAISEPEVTLEEVPVAEPEVTLEPEVIPEQEVIAPVEEGIPEEEALETEEVSFGVEIEEEEIEATEATEELDEFADIEGLEVSEFAIETDFGEDEFELDDTSEIVEGEDEEFSTSYDVEAVDEEAAEQKDMISCKKCGRQTPVSEKFCVHCGAKAR